MKKKSLGVNAILNGLRNMLNLLFPLITFPYVSRVLSVRSIGIYNFSNSIITYFLLIASLGISVYSVREGAKYRDNKEELGKFASEVFSINIVSTIVSYLLLILLTISIPKLSSVSTVIAIFSLQIAFTTLGTEWIFSIYEEYAYITLRSIFFKLISLLMMFVFVKNKNDVAIYAAITVFATVGSNVLNYIKAKRIITFNFTLDMNLKRHIKPIMIIFASNIAVLIYVNSDITLLGFFKSSYDVGLYSVSVKIYSLVKTVLSSILIVTIPRLSMLWGKEKYEEYFKVLKQIYNVLLILIVPAMIGIISMSKQIILVISGNKYVEASVSLKILSVALIFSIISWLFNECVLIPTKLEKYTFYGTLTSALLNIILNIFFIGKWGINAAATTTVVSELIGMILSIYFARNIVKIGELVENHLGCIVGSVAIYVECSIINIFIYNAFISVIVSIIVSLISYVTILIIFKDKVTVGFIHEIVSRKNN
ncbi:flippase [Ligilactobacillus salivarius]|uniref:flippase n=1 Tax=Ligilactobacillus salivarius TaxID=1624 RepID=UPI000B95FA9A|nr:flippase [Ligilactobacillus salivarius]OYP90644.1 poly-gamma-glutamate biosynthesis protein [Ligilactobacillus salivarius]